MNRVSVFIDHSNVYHSLCNLRKVDPLWVKWYNPETLSKKLVGNRELIKINYYCAPPPVYLQTERKSQYWKQLSYYEEIKKLPLTELKFAKLSGVKGDIHEKNLDTQLTTDLIVQATQNLYDTAILIANDQDYVAAVEAIKSLGRKVELVYFKTGFSWNLKKVCDLIRKARRSFFEELQFPLIAHK